MRLRNVWNHKDHFLVVSLRSELLKEEVPFVTPGENGQLDIHINLSMCSSPPRYVSACLSVVKPYHSWKPLIIMRNTNNKCLGLEEYLHMLNEMSWGWDPSPNARLFLLPIDKPSMW